MGSDFTLSNPTFAAGKFGNGLATGTGSSAQLTSQTAFTIEAWVKFTALTSTFQIVAGQQNNLFWYGIDNTGKPTARYGNPPNEQSLTGSASIQDGAFHHLALVIGPSGGKLFVDGVVVATNSVTLAASTPAYAKPLQLNTYGTDNFAVAGVIDELAVFNTERYSSNFTPPTSPYVGNETGLLRLYHLNSDGVDSTGSTPAPSGTVIPRNNTSIFYSPYNWNDDGTSANANSPGAYLKTVFTGTTFGLRIVALSGLSAYPVLRVNIDNNPAIDVQVTSGTTDYAVASGLSSGSHTLRVALVKSAETGWWDLSNAFKLVALVLDNGATVSAPTLRSKRMITYGDSIGVGTGAAAGSYPADRDSDASYFALIAEALDAEVGRVNYNGQGFSQAGVGGVPSFNTAYGQQSSGVSRLVNGVLSPAPDYAISWHGTNGSPSQSDVATAISNMRTIAPSAWIFMTVPPGGYARTVITAAANAAISAGDTKVVLVDAGSGNYQAGLTNSGASFAGADGLHPYALSQARLTTKYTTMIQHAIEPRRFTVVVSS